VQARKTRAYATAAENVVRGRLRGNFWAITLRALVVDGIPEPVVSWMSSAHFGIWLEADVY
jgi:hypothetical protein